MCSFAIASSGNRCLLETRVKEESSKGTPYCKTSNAAANVIMSEYIETDSCVKACGVDRMAVGISSDNLLDSRFSRKLCSSRCLGNCPNIAHLYHNLALGEGMYLPDLCKRVYGSWRRAFFVNLAAAAGEPKPPSTESSDEISIASEPEPPMLSATIDDDDEEFAAVPEASPLLDDDRDRVSDDSDSAAAPAASPEALDVAAPHHHRQHNLRSGFIKFKVAASPA